MVMMSVGVLAEKVMHRESNMSVKVKEGFICAMKYWL